MTTIAGQPGMVWTADGAGAVAAPVALASGLGKWIDGREVLRAIDLELRGGECVALLGGNGAGKSTLLRVLATLTPPTAGRLELFGRAITKQGAAAVRSRIGLIGHQLMLYRELSVRENLEFFARLYGVARARPRAEELIEAVGLDGRGDDAVKTLSRGMAQRAAIARALVHEPDLLLADEPFAGLDGASAERVETILRGWRDAGRTVLLATHDIGQALRLSDRAVVLAGGTKSLDERSDRLSEATIRERIGGAA
jgi:heme exporter protein A